MLFNVSLFFNASQTLHALTAVSSEHVIKLDPSLVNCIFTIRLKCAVNFPRIFPVVRSYIDTSPDSNPTATKLPQVLEHTLVGFSLNKNRFIF